MREKLMWLLQRVQDGGYIQGLHVTHLAHVSNETVADYLIANGVTIGGSDLIPEVVCDRILCDPEGKWQHQFRFKIGDKDWGISKELPEELVALAMMEQKWIPVSEPPEEHDSIWAELYGTKSWQPGLFRKCSYDVLACVEKKDGSRRVISIRTYDGKWDHNKLNEETVICWRPLPEPPKEGEQP